LGLKLPAPAKVTAGAPLWARTVTELAPLIANRGPEEQVFLNRRGEPLTRFGMNALVERHARKAAAKLPSLANKRVGPHTIRHTTATHLLRAGVDINTIRAWLGHASLATTNVYAEVDLEMKRIDGHIENDIKQAGVLQIK
jgi:integrase/recombinase XerD